MENSEMINFFGAQSVRAKKGISVAKLSGNYQLLAHNSRQLFKAQLMQGLIKWRDGNSAREIFEECILSIKSNDEFLSTLEKETKILTDLPIEKAMIIAFLIEKEFQVNFNGEVREILNSLDTAERKLDYILALTLNSNSLLEVYREEISKQIKSLEKNLQFDLMAKSYKVYFDILEKFFNNFQINDSIKLAEELYISRESNNFFSGGEQTEGGGADNKIVLDYRLAAVLKKVRYVGGSVHGWNN
jgi:predicted DNA-binding transcriptional regulator